MKRLLWHFFTLCLVTQSYLSFADDSSADWYRPANDTIQKIQNAYDKSSTLNSRKGESKQLSEWLSELQKVEPLVQGCIDSNTEKLSAIDEQISEPGDQGIQQAQQATKSDDRLDKIEQLKESINTELINCKTMSVQLTTLMTSIKALQQDILANFLLARSKDLLQIFLTNITQATDWIDSIQSYFKSRMQLQNLNSRDWSFIVSALIAGVILGIYLRKKLNHFAEYLSSPELTTKISASFCTSFARTLPMMMATIAVFSALLFILETTPLPPSIAILTSVIIYIAITSSIRAFLNPIQPAKMFLSLPDNYGTYLDRRLQSLLFLGLLVLISRQTDLREALAPEQWLLTRSTLLILTALNLVWLVFILKRVPGILGSTLLRGIMILILTASIIAEVSGYRNLSLFLIQGLTGSALLAIGLWLANAFLTDIFDGLDEGRHRWQKAIRHKLRLKDEEPIPGLLWLRLITMFSAWLVFIISVVKLWGYQAISWTILAQYITDGFEFAGYKIVPVKLAISIATFSLFITFVSWFKQETLPGWLRRTRLDHGAREAVISISGYIGIIVAALLGLSLAGFSFTNIAIIAGALSVGIGFGLQNIVNNFISGIILLFERPIRTGDWVVVGDTEGYVRKISIRSTQIETFDRADVIVPNSELISNQVTNWMLHDPWGRVIVSVGVAYGSDVEKVREILLKVADEHELVIKDGSRVSPPNVLFRGFGDSSLDFELRCFIRSIESRLSTNSDLNFAIEKALREAGIEIPFPQRDLHIRSVSEGINLNDQIDR